MKNGKKMIEMFPYEVKAQRAKKLWKEYEKTNSRKIEILLITGIFFGLLVSVVVLSLHGLTGAIFAKFDTSPYTGLFILVIGATYLLFDGTFKNWFQSAKRYFYGKR